MRRLACLAVLLLTGCVTARETATGVEPGSRHRFLEFAGAQSPVYLAAVNAPFQLPPQVVSERVAAHADGAVSGSDVTYTADRGRAARPNYRIVALFDPDQGADARTACRAVYGPTIAARYADRTNLLLAFCDEAEPIAAAKVSGRKLTGPEDPELHSMVRDGMRTMFPGQVGGPGNRPGTMGAVQLYPRPGFRLNPIDGIID